MFPKRLIIFDKKNHFCGCVALNLLKLPKKAETLHFPKREATYKIVIYSHISIKDKLITIFLGFNK